MYMYMATVVTVLLGLATSVRGLPSPESTTDDTTVENLVGSAAHDAPKPLLKVDLPAPANWFVGHRLFPNYTIKSYNAYLGDYTAASWADYMVAQCENTPKCTSVSAFSGKNDWYEEGESFGQFQGESLWFGTTFSGGPTTPGDYIRPDDSACLAITDAQFWTVPAPKKLVQVSLPPAAAASYVVGERLFPANYISGYDADLGEWTAAGWNAHVLAMCQANAACTSTAAYSSKGDGYASWIGVIYGGGATTPADYVRVDPGLGIADTQFWSLETDTNGP